MFPRLVHSDAAVPVQSLQSIDVLLRLNTTARQTAHRKITQIDELLDQMCTQAAESSTEKALDAPAIERPGENDKNPPAEADGFLSNRMI